MRGNKQAHNMPHCGKFSKAFGAWGTRSSLNSWAFWNMISRRVANQQGRG